MPNFYIIEFDDGVQLVPSIWIDFKSFKCSWPPVKSDKDFEKAVRGRFRATSDWGSFSMKEILGTSDTYERGKEKLKMSEYKSDINTTDSEVNEVKKGKLSKQAAYNVLSEDDDENNISDCIQAALPTYPRLPLSNHIEVEECHKQNEENHVLTPGEMPSKIRKRSSEFEKYVKKKLAVIDLRMQAILENQNSILEFVSKTHRGNDKEEEGISFVLPNFPIKSNGSLLEFDENLSDPVFRNCVIKELQKLGGNSVKAITNRIMEHVFNYDVGSLYSWYGAKKKLVFCELKISKLIPDIVRKHKVDATDAEVADVIRSWLRHAKEKFKRATAKRLRVTSQYSDV